MFKCEFNEHIEITDILEYRCEHLMFFTNVIESCLYESDKLKPEDIGYINELLQNEINLLLEDLRFEDVI